MANEVTRKEFDAFTSKNCANCPTPCCVRPSRISPTDILLAQSTGWKPPFLQTDKLDAVQKAASQAASALGGLYENVENPPCEYLINYGCSFPDDLRPFGCTTFICKYMYAKLDRKTLGRLKRHIQELKDAHEILMKKVQPSADDM